MTEPYDLRTVTFPSAAVTSTGHVFVSWAQVHTDHGSGLEDTDIMLVESSNTGKTWTSPAVVNDVRSSDRFMPSIAALKNGSVALAWYDRRIGANNIDIYAARATFDKSFHVTRNVRVSETSTQATDLYEAKPGQSKCFSPGRFFGDYLGVTAGPKSTLYVTWGADQLHTYATNELWFTQVHLPAHVRAAR
jgi:hypothetical protein